MEKQQTPGEMLRADLIRAGWTQRRLAVELDLDHSTVNRIVNDKEPMSLRRAVEFFCSVELALQKTSARVYLIAMIDMELMK